MPQRDWNLYGLIAMIEIERHCRGNPPVPGWLAPDYAVALEELLPIACGDLQAAKDPIVLQSLLGVIALIKGNLRLGILISYGDDEQYEDLLEKYYGWSDLYSA